MKRNLYIGELVKKKIFKKKKTAHTSLIRGREREKVSVGKMNGERKAEIEE